MGLGVYIGQTQVPLRLKEVSNIQPLYGIIIASWAHNLSKSSQGLTLSTENLVACFNLLSGLFFVVAHFNLLTAASKN